MSETSLPFKVAALYRFTPFDELERMRASLEALCVSFGIKGTLLLAREGINGTIAGRDEAIDAVLDAVRDFPGCADLEVKFSRAQTLPFRRTKVRIKHEIVTMGEPDIDPLTGAGHYIAPEAWNALIAEPNTIVIDTRNDYEVAVGTFVGAVNPETPTFRDFPAWFRAHRAELLAGTPSPKVAMFCTGGIRCEKATAFLRAEGIDEVYHLKGGILRYLETVPAAESLWKGECFVFDERVTVGHGLVQGDHVLCRACRRPVSDTQQTSPLYVEGVSCPGCHAERSDSQRAGYAERMHQTRLADARGIPHLGGGPQTV